MKKVFSAFLVMIVMFAMFSFSMTIEADYIDKISYDNFNEYRPMTENVEVGEVTKQKVIISVVLNYDDFDKESIKKDHPNAFNGKGNDKDIDDYIKDVRKKGKEHHKNKNNDIDKELKMKDYESKYVCEFLPIIEYTYDLETYQKNSKQILKAAAKSEKVKEVVVGLTEELEYDGQVEGGLILSNALDYYDNETYTGYNIVVGLLDTGTFNTTLSVFANTDYEVFAQSGSSVSDHATQMAAIIACNQGVAKESKLLSAQLIGTPCEEFEWMIDRNVNVINISLGEASPNGTYQTFSAICDYVVRNYDVTIVASAGNYGETTKFVTNPGLGYNVITVGATDLGNDLMDLSSYRTSGTPSKPTLVVCGESTDFDDLSYQYSGAGTSVSSAIATGMVAMLMESNTQLKTQPERIHAILVANSETLAGMSYTQANGFDDHVGAGSFDLLSSVRNSTRSSAFTNTYGVSGTMALSYHITVQAGNTLKVAVMWLANSDTTASGTTFTKYDLKLEDANGNVYASTVTHQDNVLMIEYTPAITKGFYVRLYQYSSAVDQGVTDELCMAYCIRMPE